MNFSEPVEAGAISLPCSLKLLNDRNLVVRAKAGDTAAFVELGVRHSCRVRRTVYRITRNWEDAEDALRESLLKALRHLNGSENRSSFSSWLTRIAITALGVFETSLHAILFRKVISAELKEESTS